MKLLSTLFVTYLLCLTSVFSNRLTKKLNLSKKLRDGPVCLNKKDSVLPTLETQKDAIDNAKRQSQAARNLLNNPGPIAREILVAAANNLYEKVFKHLSCDSLADTGFNRAMNGPIAKVFKRIHPIETEIQVMKEIGKGNNDYIKLVNVGSIIGSIGDLGTSIVEDTILFENESVPAPSLVQNSYNDAAKRVVDEFDISEQQLDLIRKNMAGMAGGSIIAPCKKAERGFVMENGNIKLAERCGLLSVVDDTMNVPNQEKPYCTSWPWQTVPQVFINKCPKEPFAGHFSGSTGEILMTLDILTSDNENSDLANSAHLGDFNYYYGKDKDSEEYKYRRCKAAIGAAGLVSIGYHSAIEVYPAVRMYLGLDTKLVYSLPICKDGQGGEYTDEISKLFEECTAQTQ
jgi:hypothetical protein